MAMVFQLSTCWFHNIQHDLSIVTPSVNTIMCKYTTTKLLLLINFFINYRQTRKFLIYPGSANNTATVLPWINKKDYFKGAFWSIFLWNSVCFRKEIRDGWKFCSHYQTVSHCAEYMYFRWSGFLVSINQLLINLLTLNFKFFPLKYHDYVLYIF